MSEKEREKLKENSVDGIVDHVKKKATVSLLKFTGECPECGKRNNVVESVSMDAALMALREMLCNNCGKSMQGMKSFTIKGKRKGFLG